MSHKDHTLSCWLLAVNGYFLRQLLHEVIGLFRLCASVRWLMHLYKKTSAKTI